MRCPKLHFMLPLLAGIAILISGCNLSEHRRQTARIRCEQKMAEARLSAAREFLALGDVDQARKILDPYLPESELPSGRITSVAEEEGDDETPSQYAKVSFEEELDPASQPY